MSTWLNDAWASVRSLTRRHRCRELCSRFSDASSSRGLFRPVAVVVVGWLVLYRQWRQLTQGKSDQVIFSANLFTPLATHDQSSAG